MNTNNSKTNEQMLAELEQALSVVTEKIDQLIRNGSYKLESMSRDYKTNRLDWAFLWVGKHRLMLKADSKWPQNHGETELNLTLPENPITPDIVEAWDRQVIDKEIAYHRATLEGLLKVKQELDNNKK